MRMRVDNPTLTNAFPPADGDHAGAIQENLTRQTVALKVAPTADNLGMRLVESAYLAGAHVRFACRGAALGGAGPSGTVRDVCVGAGGLRPPEMGMLDPIVKFSASQIHDQNVLRVTVALVGGRPEGLPGFMRLFNSAGALLPDSNVLRLAQTPGADGAPLGTASDEFSGCPFAKLLRARKKGTTTPPAEGAQSGCESGDAAPLPPSAAPTHRETTVSGCKCSAHCRTGNGNMGLAGLVPVDIADRDWCPVAATDARCSSKRWDWCEYRIDEDWEALSWTQKSDALWAKVLEGVEDYTLTNPIPGGAAQQVLAAASVDRRMLALPQDFRRTTRPKSLHTLAAHCPVQLDVFAPSGYTGLFSAGSKRGVPWAEQSKLAQVVRGTVQHSPLEHSPPAHSTLAGDGCAWLLEPEQSNAIDVPSPFVSPHVALAAAPMSAASASASSAVILVIFTQPATARASSSAAVTTRYNAPHGPATRTRRRPHAQMGVDCSARATPPSATSATSATASESRWASHPRPPPIDRPRRWPAAGVSSRERPR